MYVDRYIDGCLVFLVIITLMRSSWFQKLQIYLRYWIYYLFSFWIETARRTRSESCGVRTKRTRIEAEWSEWFVFFLTWCIYQRCWSICVISTLTRHEFRTRSTYLKKVKKKLDLFFGSPTTLVNFLNINNFVLSWRSQSDRNAEVYVWW